MTSNFILEMLKVIPKQYCRGQRASTARAEFNVKNRVENVQNGTLLRKLKTKTYWRQFGACRFICTTPQLSSPTSDLMKISLHMCGMLSLLIRFPWVDWDSTSSRALAVAICTDLCYDGELQTCRLGEFRAASSIRSACKRISPHNLLKDCALRNRQSLRRFIVKVTF